MLKRSKTEFHQLSSNLLRYLLAGLFLWAGAIKLSDPKNFARNVDAFGLVPENWLVIIAIGLPILEIILALAVIMRWSYGLPLMAALLLLFIGILWYGVLNDLNVDCGCFSLTEQDSYSSLRQAFWRDWLMLAATGYVFFIDHLFKSRLRPVELTTHR